MDYEKAWDLAQLEAADEGRAVYWISIKRMFY